MALTKVDAQLLNGAVTADSSGNVGIGTASPTAKLTIKAGNGNQAYFDNAGEQYTQVTLKNNGTSKGAIWVDNTTSLYEFYGYSGVGMTFGTNATERMRIDSSGNLTIGGTSALGKVGVYWNSSSQQGLVFKTSSSTFNGYPVIFYNNVDVASGIITQAQNSVTYGTSSDYRLKENIEPMVGALDKVSSLKPVTYTWKSDGSDGQGFIAHELQEVCPDAVSGNKDAVNEDGSIKPQSVDTSFLVATLTAAIQELKAELDATKAEVAALKAGA